MLNDCFLTGPFFELLKSRRFYGRRLSSSLPHHDSGLDLSSFSLLLIAFVRVSFCCACLLSLKVLFPAAGSYPSRTWVSAGTLEPAIPTTDQNATNPLRERWSTFVDKTHPATGQGRSCLD